MYNPTIAPLTARDLEMYELLLAGTTLADTGRKYGVSRQRVKQVVNKLSAWGKPTNAKAVRDASKHAGYLEQKVSKFGASYSEIAASPELLALLKKRITLKRNHAMQNGVPFDLTISDLYPLPEVCPVLGIPIHYGTGHTGAADNAMSIDRIDPSKGYVRGNIQLMSMRANRIKNNATPDELRRVADFYALCALHSEKVPLDK
jgi:hypothetical protein